MKKRYIIVTKDISEEYDNIILKYLEGNFSWWHWIGNFWLVINRNSEMDAEEIRNELKKLIPNIEIFVLEIEGTYNWAGNLKNSPKGKWGEWITDNFDSGD